jgi:hypothetical protein
MRKLGRFAGWCTPAFLFLGPVLVAFDHGVNILGILGGLFLGLGLLGLYYRIGD